MKKPTKRRKWRRQYSYDCKDCGKPRTTVVYGRKQREECTNCTRQAVPDNQLTLQV